MLLGECLVRGQHLEGRRGPAGVASRDPSRRDRIWAAALGPERKEKTLLPARVPPSPAAEALGVAGRQKSRFQTDPVASPGSPQLYLLP